jgi:hypothetical protein
MAENRLGTIIDTDNPKVTLFVDGKERTFLVEKFERTQDGVYCVDRHTSERNYLSGPKRRIELVEI